MDGGGFEPPKQYAADLQSVPFGHSGIHPFHCHFKICPDNEILYHMNFSDARYNFYFFKFFCPLLRKYFTGCLFQTQYHCGKFRQGDVQFSALYLIGHRIGRKSILMGIHDLL